jgi:hypothetical protein
MRRLAPIGVLAWLVLSVGPAAAQTPPPPAPPPANDARENAQPITSVPGEVSGTTVGATAAENDPRSSCGPVTGTVWYSLDDQPPRRIIIRAQAQGELDAVVSVYRRARSRLVPVACAATNENGRAALAFDPTAPSYLVVVGQAEDSAPGPFVLSLSLAEPSARPPGPRLPRAGAAATLDTLSDTDDAWSLVMRVGTTYRVNLVTYGECLGLSLFPPKTRSFASRAPIKHRGCGGYFLHTPAPGGGGVYSLHVESRGGEARRQRYRLEAGVARADDLAPGLRLPSGGERRGSLNGTRLDVVDHFYFDVADRAEATLRLRTGGAAAFDLVLLNENGGRVNCACFSSGSVQLRHRPLESGRYYAVVRARDASRGTYRLTLLLQALTTTEATISGARSQTVPPGRSVALEATVTPPPGGGLARLWLERFVPLEGWHFHRVFRVPVHGGRAVRAWRPPTQGRWRLRARYLGTRLSSRSESGWAVVTVRASQRPL